MKRIDYFMDIMITIVISITILAFVYMMYLETVAGIEKGCM